MVPALLSSTAVTYLVGRRSFFDEHHLDTGVFSFLDLVSRISDTASDGIEIALHKKQKDIYDDLDRSKNILDYVSAGGSHGDVEIVDNKSKLYDDNFYFVLDEQDNSFYQKDFDFFQKIAATKLNTALVHSEAILTFAVIFEESFMTNMKMIIRLRTKIKSGLGIRIGGYTYVLAIIFWKSCLECLETACKTFVK